MRDSGHRVEWPESRWLVGGPIAIAALVLAALTMRAPITVVGPLLDAAADELGDLALAGLLVSLPLLAFSLAAPVFPSLVRRTDLARAIQVALGVLAAGLLLRQLPGTVSLLSGTVIMGIGIAALNVAMPVVVKARWPNRVGLLTGIHTSVTAIAAAAAAGLALPIAEQLGWRAALAVIGVVVAAAAGMAALFATALTTRVVDPNRRQLSVRPVLAHPTTRLLVVLMALQAGTYYALVSWLPAILLAEGRSAADVGAMQAVFVVLGVVAGPAAGIWLQSGRRREVLALSSTLPLVVSSMGLVVAADFAWAWVVLAGVSCGATFTMTLALFAMKSAAPAVTVVISTACQALGYAVAALTPPILGAVAALQGEWAGAVMIVACLAIVQVVVAVGAVRSPVVREISG